MFDLKTFLSNWITVSQSSEIPASGETGASETQIAALEARIGRKLPPSYRAFLAETNGWHNAGHFIDRVFPAEEVDWFANTHQDWIDAYTAPALVDENDPINDLKTTLQISDVGDSAVLLLNPNVIDEETGEWEAWFFGNWVPGEKRHFSFEDLMRRTFDNFVYVETNKQKRK